jgi:hypothetical protein
MAGATEVVVKLRVTLHKPPPGVQICLQRGKDELVSPVMSAGRDLKFELDVRVQPGSGGAARLLGPFTQGPATARFFYICCGTYAGQAGSPWARKIKVPLSGITWALAEQAGGRFLQASFEGTAKDGGPAAATVKLVDSWRA